MNKNKKVTLISIFALTLFATTGCGQQSVDEVNNDVDLAEELVLDTYATVCHDALLAGLKNEGDNLNIDTGIEMKDFISDEAVDESLKKVDGIKNKTLKEITEVYLNTADEISALIQDTASGDISIDKLLNELEDLNKKTYESLKSDKKLMAKIAHLASKYNLRDTTDTLQEDVLDRLNDKYGKKLKSLLVELSTKLLGKELAGQLSGELTSQLSDLKSNITESSPSAQINNNTTTNSAINSISNLNSPSAAKVSDEINAIRNAATEFSSIDYEKGKYEIVDTICDVISDFYSQGLQGVKVQLFEKYSDIETKKESYVPISNETKEKLEKERQEVINSIKAGYDSVIIPRFHHSETYHLDGYSHDVSNSISLNFSLSHLDKYGNKFNVFGNDLSAFAVVIENGEVKIVVE